jgi:hypothetical protein
MFKYNFYNWNYNFRLKHIFLNTMIFFNIHIFKTSDSNKNLKIQISFLELKKQFLDVNIIFRIQIRVFQV